MNSEEKRGMQFSNNQLDHVSRENSWKGDRRPPGLRNNTNLALIFLKFGSGQEIPFVIQEVTYFNRNEVNKELTGLSRLPLFRDDNVCDL